MFQIYFTARCHNLFFRTKQYYISTVSTLVVSNKYLVKNIQKFKYFRLFLFKRYLIMQDYSI